MTGKTVNPPSYDGPPQPYQQHQQGPVIVVQGAAQTNVVGQAVGPKPATLTCPSCGESIVTRVKHMPTTKTHLVAFGMCVFCCWCCLCIPYCTDSCQNADHYCPNCDAFIGVYTS
ncbi:lipopolysaccharide-induced tumor necrosis factor-alpha factor homolog [Hyposmocoma kahamanoa]|uniref:lipopolysaccharide-induced tumor necrosis factor-alpha factor homolog n=1 Tax=Hyposmocoma kahamanoa TaxID=1477025 RepID=UPI000E6D8ED2|nr:lipopolysaccharide-induced tumor necrosis factor-alpha factor homolog [Hyposmocoma kahamanoa]